MFRRENKENAAEDEYEEPPIEGADFEVAIEEAGFGVFNYYIFFSLIPVTWSFMFNTSAMSFIIPAIECEFKLTSLQKGVLNGAIYAGMIPSGLFLGTVSDVVGRQNMLFWGLLADAVCGILAAFAVSYQMMALFRFLGGIAMCATYTTAYTLLVEFLVQSRRDTGVMLMGCFTSTASFIQPLLAYFIIPMTISIPLFSSLILNSWRLFILISSLPSAVGALLVFFIPESPKFLISQGRNEDALKVFRLMFSRNRKRPKTAYPVRSLLSSVNPDGSSAHEKKSILKELIKGFKMMKPLFMTPFLKPAIIIFILQAGSLMSYNVMRLHQPETLVLFFANKAHGVCLCKMKKHIPEKAFETRRLINVDKRADDIGTTPMGRIDARFVTSLPWGSSKSRRRMDNITNSPEFRIDRRWDGSVSIGDVRKAVVTDFTSNKDVGETILEDAVPISGLARNSANILGLPETSNFVDVGSIRGVARKPPDDSALMRKERAAALAYVASSRGEHGHCMENHPVDMRIYSVVALLGVFSFLYYIMTVFLVKGLGKKSLYIYAMLLCALCLAVYPWSSSLYVILLAGIFLALMFTTNNLVLGCSLTFFPTTLRASAVNLTMLFGRLGTLLGNLIFPKFIEESCYLGFLTLGVINVVCALICAFLLKDTVNEDGTVSSRPPSVYDLGEEEDAKEMAHSMYMIHS